MIDNKDDKKLNTHFHVILKELFYWHESRRLMKIMKYSIQWFLMYMSVEKGVKGFICIREIGRLIIKLIYNIRSCIFNELMIRYKIRLIRNHIDRELRELIIYIKKILQNSFDFLIEMILIVLIFNKIESYWDFTCEIQI